MKEMHGGGVVVGVSKVYSTYEDPIEGDGGSGRVLVSGTMGPR